jgi:hypothetical protein
MSEEGAYVRHDHTGEGLYRSFLHQYTASSDSTDDDNDDENLFGNKLFIVIVVVCILCLLVCLCLLRYHVTESIMDFREKVESNRNQKVLTCELLCHQVNQNTLALDHADPMLRFCDKCTDLVDAGVNLKYCSICDLKYCKKCRDARPWATPTQIMTYNFGCGYSKAPPWRYEEEDTYCHTTAVVTEVVKELASAQIIGETSRTASRNSLADLNMGDNERLFHRLRENSDSSRPVRHSSERLKYLLRSGSRVIPTTTGSIKLPSNNPSIRYMHSGSLEFLETYEVHAIED